MGSVIQFRANFFSDALGFSTSATILLPQESSQQIGLGGGLGTTTPVLYLLHGYSDDDTIWLRRTSIERYASARGLAVVMPNAGTSWYCNEVHGHRYWDFLTDELPTLVQQNFRVSSEPEQTYVAGLSMGGFGAFKWALNQPSRFAAAGSLSGALDARQLPPEREFVDLVWGSRPVDGTIDDLVHLVGAADPTSLPRLWVTCGTEDFLVDQNRTFLAAATKAGVPVETVWQPGEHEWGYWDRTIGLFLDFALGSGDAVD